MAILIAPDTALHVASGDASSLQARHDRRKRKPFTRISGTPRAHARLFGHCGNECAIDDEGARRVTFRAANPEDNH